MEEFKGTPGPWHWDKEGLGNKNHIVLGKEYPAEMTSKANKALIAAAPELLKALQDMVSRIEYYANLDDSNKPSIEDWAYTYNSSDMDAARNAIAKALGKE